MTKPGPMQWVAGPPPLWATVIDVLIGQIQTDHKSCPPWSGQVACPLKTDGVEKCWGERDCWLYWAYMLAVMRMATESAQKASKLQGEQPA